MVDHCSDNYHVPTSHLSSARVQTRYLGRPRLSHEDQFASPNRECGGAGALAHANRRSGFSSAREPQAALRVL